MRDKAEVNIQRGGDDRYSGSKYTVKYWCQMRRMRE